MRRLLCGTGGAALSLLVPSVLNAQDMPRELPTLDIPEDEYVPTPIHVGSASVYLGGTARFEYDNNIYAQASHASELKVNLTDDEKFIARPFVNIIDTGHVVDFTGKLQGDFRKYLHHDTESANGGQVSTNTTWHMSANDGLTLQAGWEHAIEDRGEPEARIVTSIGPRESNDYSGNLNYSHQGARIGFSLQGSINAYRYLNDVDLVRNLNDYGLQAQVSHRITPIASAFLQGFIQHRDFEHEDAGVNRDSNTYGANVGVEIDPGGSLRGNAAVGVYHFSPRDSSLKSRTGPSVQVGLIYQFRARTAFNLDGFIGNVATYQAGAQSRQDTRVSFGVQQEIRHNLRAQASFIYRRNRYYGSGIVQDTYGGFGELEYIINQRMTVAVDVRYSDRNSTAALQDYSRLRTGLELRFHY